LAVHLREIFLTDADNIPQKTGRKETRKQEEIGDRI